MAVELKPEKMYCMHNFMDVDTFFEKCPASFLLLYLAVVCSSGYHNKIKFQCFLHCFQLSDFASGLNMRLSITSTVIATLCSFETVMHSCSSVSSDLVFQQLYRKTLTVIFFCLFWLDA